MKDYRNWIEDYLNGELSIEQNKVFEEQLQVDPELVKELEKYAEVKTNLDLFRLRHKVKAMNLGKSVSGRRNKLMWLAIAASIVLLIAIVVLIRIYNSPDMTAGQEWAVDNSLEMNTMKDTPITRVIVPRDSIIDQPKRDASKGIHQDKISSRLVMINLSVFRDIDRDSNPFSIKTDSIQFFLRQKDYRTVKRLLNKDPMDSHRDEFTFLSGYCSFKLMDYETAKSIFLKLSSNPQYAYESQWNYLMCLLLLDENAEAEEIFEIMRQDPNHPYHSESTKLRKELKSKNQ